jgi:hypothetical protein
MSEVDIWDMIRMIKENAIEHAKNDRPKHALRHGQRGETLDSIDGYDENHDPKPEVKEAYEIGLYNWLYSALEGVEPSEISNKITLDGFISALLSEGKSVRNYSSEYHQPHREKEKDIDKAKKHIEEALSTYQEKEKTLFEKGMQVARDFLDELTIHHFKCLHAKDYGLDPKKLSERQLRKYFLIHKDIALRFKKAYENSSEESSEGLAMDFYQAKKQEAVELLNTGEHSGASNAYDYMKLLLLYLKHSYEVLSNPESEFVQRREDDGFRMIGIDDPSIVKQRLCLERFDIQGKCAELKALRRELARRRNDSVYDLNQRIKFFVANEKYEEAAKARNDLERMQK